MCTDMCLDMRADVCLAIYHTRRKSYCLEKVTGVIDTASAMLIFLKVHGGRELGCAEGASNTAEGIGGDVSLPGAHPLFLKKCHRG